MKFRSDVAGKIHGIKFWKSSANDSGPHTGLLYSTTGAVLAQGTFTSETSSGWQTVTFSTPVDVAAGTTYIAAYHTRSGWSQTNQYFYLNGVDAPPLHAPKYATNAPNGLFAYGATPVMPFDSRGNNYWVDVNFASGTGGTGGTGGSGGTGGTPPSGSVSLWSAPVQPAPAFTASMSGITLGVKFRSDVAGKVHGIKFWKASPNDSGTHTALLYGPTGAVLAQATFSSETSSGWQSVTFSTPVDIAANANYIAAYHTTSGWSQTNQYFYLNGVDTPPLHAPKYATGAPNGLFAWGATPVLPFDSRGNNYWVDVIFQ
jgi:hypothetical protein